MELSNCQSRSLHAALRSSRRPLKLLSEMGKAREACGTLLKVCSTAIRFEFFFFKSGKGRDNILQSFIEPHSVRPDVII